MLMCEVKPHRSKFGPVFMRCQIPRTVTLMMVSLSISHRLQRFALCLTRIVACRKETGGAIGGSSSVRIAVI